MKSILVCLLVTLWIAGTANDLCFNAVNLTPTAQVCGSPTVMVSFSSNNPSSTPLNTCATPLPDLWLYLHVPAGGNSYMIRRRANTNIDARAEVLYKPVCSLGSSCCEVGMTVIGCFNLDEFPNAIVLESAAPGDYYIRVWDDGGAASGILDVSAHVLTGDPSGWIICDDVSGEGSGFRANQLIIQPSESFDLSIYDSGFQPIDSCNCTDPPLFLFQADDFKIFLEGKITAQNDPEVEGSGYNYRMDPIRLPYADGCPGPADCSPIVQYSPNNPQSKARVAIVDSGINTEHAAFANAHWSNLMDPEDCIQVQEIGYDFKFEQSTPEDTLGHGSWVAGTITEDFPEDIQLELMSLKFYGAFEHNLLFDAICAMYFAAEQGASTVVTSWGFRAIEFPELLENSLTHLLQQDVLVVSSAGNRGENNDSVVGKFPANAEHKNVISVTAFDPNTQGKPDYANFGAITVDLAAVDHVIAPSSVTNGTSLTDRDSVVGTSISAPRVARTAAIMKAQYPELFVADIRTCLLDSVEFKPLLTGLVATSGVLDHDAALSCAAKRAAEYDCVPGPLMIVGTIINDVSYHTSSFATISATIEPSATVSIGAGNEILVDPTFLVAEGAEIELSIGGCAVSEQ